MTRRGGAFALGLTVIALAVPAAAPAVSARSELRDPARLLRLFPVPPRATLINPPYGNGPRVLRESSSQLAFPSESRHRIWRVRMPFGQALAFVKAHRPAAVITHFGESIGGLTMRNREATWTFRAIPHLIPFRWLSVTLVELAPRTTAIRVDAQDSWSVRPPDEKLPAGIREVTISRSRWKQYPALFLRVTDPKRVRKVIRRFDALPAVDPVLQRRLMCPLLFGPSTTVDFRSASGGILAHAELFGLGGVGSVCNHISFYVDGREETPLAGNVFGPLTRPLGVQVADLPPRR